MLTHSLSLILLYKVDSQRKRGDSRGWGTGERKRGSEKRIGGEIKRTKKERER